MAPIPGPIANLVPSLEGSAAGNYFPNLKLHFFEMKNFQISKFSIFYFFSGRYFRKDLRNRQLICDFKTALERFSDGK